MSAWLDPLRRALDCVAAPVPFFFRDDDAGWEDDRLFALLELFAEHTLPIDLAVIPDALTPRLAQRLRARIEVHPRQVAIHQHGFAHTNHEPEGRKCEFGPARSVEAQRRDLERGARRLHELLGDHVRPIFTPPWNRCTTITGASLAELGFRALSRDHTAAPLAVAGLIELPVRVDWYARRKGLRLSRVELGALLAAAVTLAQPVGVMFHHAPMDADERRAAGELLRLLAAHDAVHCQAMWALVEAEEAAMTSRGTVHT